MYLTIFKEFGREDQILPKFLGSLGKTPKENIYLFDYIKVLNF